MAKTATTYLRTTDKNIEAQHPHYKKRANQWREISDAIEGEDKVKSEGDKYLPRPNKADTSPENKERYEHLKALAVFHNVTGRTQSNLVGQCFATSPVFKGPENLEILVEDVDGAGVSAEQQSKSALGMTLAYSRAGLLVDYPSKEADEEGNVTPTTVKEQEDGHVRANILLFEPWRVINWRVGRVGAKSLLTLVMIEEDYVEEDDGYEAKLCKQWRELALEDGKYVARVWRKCESGFGLVSESFPQDGKGSSMQEIPFVFIGAETNDTLVEKPLLLDICKLNFAHYRNSAGFEEVVYINGQPTLVLTGLDKKWITDQMPKGVQLGSRGAVLLPVGGSAELLQTSESSLTEKAMEQKVKLMSELGAKLVERREVTQTATEKSIDQASETSILAGVVCNVKEAYTRCFGWAADFEKLERTGEGFEDGLTYELNTDFAIARMTPEERRANREDYDGKLITWDEARAKLKDSGVATMDDEEAKGMIEDEAEEEFKRAQAAFEAANPLGDEEDDKKKKSNDEE